MIFKTRIWKKGVSVFPKTKPKMQPCTEQMRWSKKVIKWNMILQQSFSSLISLQSASPSQCHLALMHQPSSHWNSLWELHDPVQFFSSAPWMQSGFRSQCHDFGIQRLFGHWNSVVKLQILLSEIQTQSCIVINHYIIH